MTFINKMKVKKHKKENKIPPSQIKAEDACFHTQIYHVLINKN